MTKGTKEYEGDCAIRTLRAFVPLVVNGL